MLKDHHEQHRQKAPNTPGRHPGESGVDHESSYEQAEAHLLAAHEVLLPELGQEHEWTQEAVRRLAELYEAWGKPEKAEEYRASPGNTHQ